MPHFFLADNGSVRAAATLTLRRLAAQLAERAGHPVQAVSLQHADRIDAAELDGQPAVLLAQALREHLAAGQREFVLIPLFFGLSRALTSFVPEIVNELKQEFGDFALHMADVLYPLPDGDDELVCILYDHATGQPVSDVVLVDHGSPSPTVTRVREHIAQALQARARGRFSIGQAVMERRPGPEYDFNGPLLEDWLRQRAQQGVRDVRVLMQFLLPGKHAGEGGDVADIIAGVQRDHPGLRVQVSPLISDHPGLPELLFKRLQSAL
jgi:sirohydrochlorin ferrochelatase